VLIEAGGAPVADAGSRDGYVAGGRTLHSLGSVVPPPLNGSIVSQPMNARFASSLFLAGALLSGCSRHAGEVQRLPMDGGSRTGSPEMRGTIDKAEDGSFVYQYYDVHEHDRHTAMLAARGFQGGGPTWEGIIYGLLRLRSPSTLGEIRFDAEGDGLAIWSRRRPALETIGRLVAEAKRDPAVLSEAIDVAKRDGRIE
jgi:hypothetical protein